jgi:Tol biopolymer transport system component
LVRRLIPAVLVILALGVLALMARRAAERDPNTRLAWVATAHQLGPVGYRDPAGAISPDGKWVAYSEGRFLRVRAIDGGPIVDLPPGEAQIRNISWHPDSRTILADGYQTQSGWALYDRAARTRRGLWIDNRDLAARAKELRQAVWSPDGRSIAAIVNGREGQELVIAPAGGAPSEPRRFPHRIAFPAWTPRGEIACVSTIDGRARVTVPCGGSPIRIDPDRDVSGPIAFAPDGRTVYVSVPNDAGSLDLWSAPIGGGAARRLTSFARDAYAPSVAADGTVQFKVQSYRTLVAIAPSAGGPTLPLATFQSETPSWDPTGRWIGVTYGSWRRFVDDARYPDIAQDAGLIAADPDHPSTAPAEVVHASASEDQSLCWSPNGRWIAFHSHKDQSDDLWMRPAAGDAQPRRISFLGRGAETGWPRWSPDGRWLLFDGASRTTRRSVAYTIGVDQETGVVTGEAREIVVRGVDAEMSHAEWLPDSAHIVAVGKEAPGRHILFTVARDGGEARVIRRFASEHDAPGLASSPDGRDVAFIAPGPDGFFQVFRMPILGGELSQVTTDPSHKTQPAWSPDGRRIAFTVWSYDAQFWTIKNW